MGKTNIASIAPTEQTAKPGDIPNLDRLVYLTKQFAVVMAQKHPGVKNKLIREFSEKLDEAHQNWEQLRDVCIKQAGTKKERALLQSNFNEECEQKEKALDDKASELGRLIASDPEDPSKTMIGFTLDKDYRKTLDKKTIEKYWEMVKEDEKCKQVFTELLKLNEEYQQFLNDHKIENRIAQHRELLQDLLNTTLKIEKAVDREKFIAPLMWGFVALTVLTMLVGITLLVTPGFSAPGFICLFAGMAGLIMSMITLRTGQKSMSDHKFFSSTKAIAKYLSEPLTQVTVSTTSSTK